MYKISSSSMSEPSKNFDLHKDHKTYSKTANEWYLASALYDGVEDGNLRQLTTLLINKGANPNIVLPEYGVAPIHLASGLEDIQFGLEAVRLFLSYGGDPNVQSSDGLTPVHIASVWGRNLVLQLLLSNGGDPWLLDNDNKNAFSLAHEQEQWETFQVLDVFKNNFVLERPEISKGIRYKLHLDRVKVFNNDICAEYKALPLPLKCCSTQTLPLTSRIKTPSITSADSHEGKGAESSRKMIPCPPSIDLVVKNSYDNFDDSYDLKFNICPNKEELQALELVRKHRQGITVFEYVPESGYHGDNENILNSNNQNSRGSSEDSTTGSLSSLVRGSVFADVKSKLRLFYENVSGSNGNKECSWRLNLIRKRKEKDKLKKQEKGSIKANSYCGNMNEGFNRKNIKETHSDFNDLILKTPSELSKDAASHFSRLKNSSELIDFDERSSGSFKIDDSISEIRCNTSKKSFSSLWKFKAMEKSKKGNIDQTINSLTNLKSFHRFEDVFDSVSFNDENQESAIQCNEPNVSVDVASNNDKSSENSGKCICQSICLDILQRINSRTFNNNEIGFLVNNNSNNNTHMDYNSKESDDLLVHDTKRDIGFNFDESLKSTCWRRQEKQSDVKSSVTRNNCPHDRIISSDIEANLSEYKDQDTVSRKNIQSASQELDDSFIFTEDESTTSKEFFCFKRTNSLERNVQNAINDVNNDKIDTSVSSTTDIYFSCISADQSKEISKNETNLHDTNDKSLNQIADSSCLTPKISIISNSISEKHIEGIAIYESDDFSENDEECEILNTAFHDSTTSFAVKKVASSTPEKETIYETDCFDSLTAVLGSSERSFGSENSNICNSNSPSGDYKLSLQPGPSLANENREIVPRIKIPDDTSSCSEQNIVKSSCNRTHSLQPIEHKWTCADIASSDDDTDISIIEEYLYTDEEDGVVLVEERHLPTRVINKITENNKQLCLSKGQQIDKKRSGTSTETETESALSSVDTAYETDELRKELKEFGLSSGPITGGTKRVYLRQLKRVRRKPLAVHSVTPKPEFSPELERLLRTEGKDLFENWSHLEIEMSRPFLSPDPTKRWREGVAKTSFTYLLLDPRVTQDLPYRAKSLSNKERLTCFLQAIFYVGRGKRARPYSHLTEALVVWNNWKLVSSKKIKKIHEIWTSGLGVVCLQVFQNVIPSEAMTREAAMIDSLGLQELCNERIGDYYGTASTWNNRQRQQLGAVLLVRALNILLGEGERQIRPRDIERK